MPAFLKEPFFKRLVLVGLLLTVVLILLAGQAPDAQPKITWSVLNVAETMFPGTTKTLTVGFTSDQALGAVVIEPTPSLKAIVSPAPATLSYVGANQNYVITLTISVPQVFEVKLFDGTIHVKNAGNPPRTYAKPLPVTVRTSFVSHTDNAGFALNIPSDWVRQLEGDVAVFSNVQEQGPLSETSLRTESSFQIHVHEGANPNLLSIDDWFDQTLAGKLPAEPLLRAPFIVDGRSAVRLEITELGTWRHLYVPRGADVVEISFGLFEPLFVDEYESMVTSFRLP